MGEIIMLLNEKQYRNLANGGKGRLNEKRSNADKDKQQYKYSKTLVENKAQGFSHKWE